MPGVHIPDEVVERIEQAGPPKEQKAEGKRLCVELIQEIREIEGVHGVHVMAYRQEEFVSEIIQASGVLQGRRRRARAPASKRGNRDMTETVVSSATRTVVIGFDRPFCIIGERINPTGRKKLAAEMAAGDFSTVERDTLAQVEAGAHMLDVNAGIPLADEPAILAKTIQLVQSLTDLPLSIDSSIVAALEAGLAVYKGRPLVNSVTGEEERLEAVLPLIKKYDCAVVAISNDETGISEDPDVRFEVAKKIVHHAQDYGIKPKDIVVDPLVMPIGALGNAGKSAFHLLRRLKEELKVNSTCGASNVSFGLPNRHGLNAAFLSMASLAGMTSAIMNPLHLEEMQGVMGADVMLGKDEHCRRWLTRFREAPAEGSAAAAAAGARGERRRRREALPDERRARRLHAVRQARPVRARHAGPDRGAAARRRHRFSVCGGRAICGRCQVTVGEGSFAKHGITSTAEHLTRLLGDRAALPGQEGPAAGPAAVLPGAARWATSSSTCRPTARCTSRWSASAPRCARSSSIPRPGSTMSRSRSRTCTGSAATSSGSRRRCRRSGGWGG